MKIYHVESKECYDELMIELEEKGLIWISGHEPTQFDGFEDYGRDTCVYEEDGMLSYASVKYFKNTHKYM